MIGCKNEMVDDAIKCIGWREWVGLPQIGIPRIKAKIDTGARTSALHAYSIDTFKEKGIEKVRFKIHPYQRNATKQIICVAEIFDVRWVTDSGGHREERFVIKTNLSLANELWPIEITLTNRDTMAFRMLLGRTALIDRFCINPARSYIYGKRKDCHENSYIIS